MRGVASFLVWLAVLAVLTQGCAASADRTLYQDDWSDWDEARDGRIEECYTEHADTCMCATEVK